MLVCNCVPISAIHSRCSVLVVLVVCYCFVVTIATGAETQGDHALDERVWQADARRNAASASQSRSGVASVCQRDRVHACIERVENGKGACLLFVISCFFLAACHSRFSCAQMFAMPFVCALDGHKDGVFCMRRHAGDLKSFLSGSFDGGSLFCLSPFARVAC